MNYPRLEMDADGIVSLMTLTDPDGDPVTERLGHVGTCSTRVPIRLMRRWYELWSEWVDAGLVGDDIKAETARGWRERL